jgi:signal transduction histidine kinase
VTIASESALSPVFVSLRVGLNALVVGLVVLVIATSFGVGSPTSIAANVLAVIFLGSYVFGALVGRAHSSEQRLAAQASARPGQKRRMVSLPIVIWLGLLSLNWVALAVLSPEAMYLVFPLFFLYLHLLPAWRGTTAVALSTVVAIIIFGLSRGFSLAGIIGPIIGAAVAVAIGLGYRSLAREATEREHLIAELTTTRQHLAEIERAAGVLDERGRLAREIHDTVSQSLSSIVMLLHAADRTGELEETAAIRVHQARDAAEAALAETRQFINELSPPSLRTGTLVDAIGRLATQTAETSGLRVEVTTAGRIEVMPTRIEATLLRIAQGAISNVVQHAVAERVDITLTVLDQEIILDIVDDGIGFEPLAVQPQRELGGPRSFGLLAMRDRMAELDGTLTVESSPGGGTSIAASVDLDGCQRSGREQLRSTEQRLDLEIDRREV